MSTTEPAARAFEKSCKPCELTWLKRDEFLNDPTIELIGYQANFQNLGLGLFLFNHNNCHSTMAIYAEQFRDLYDGPVYSERRTGSEDCLGLCLHKEELRACTVKCECAFVREISNIIHNWRKQSVA